MNIKINSRIIPPGMEDTSLILDVKSMAKHKKKQIIEKRDA